MSPGLIRSVHGAGKDIYAWTVNDPLEMSGMISKGVDGLITDEPALVHFRQTIEKLEAAGYRPRRVQLLEDALEQRGMTEALEGELERLAVDLRVGQVVDLVSATGAWSRDQTGFRLLFHRRQEHQRTDLHRQFVVLGLKAK